LSIVSILLFFLLEKRHFSFFYFLLVDDFLVFIKIVVCLITILVVLVMNFYFILENMFKSFEFFVVFLLSVLSMFFVISSSDLLTLYISIEMQSLSMFILAASKQNSVYSIEAGLKYFVLGTLSSGFLLLGSSFFYGYTGITRFVEFTSFLQYGFSPFLDFVFFSLIFFIIAFFFKFSAAPFHVWSPDVYEGAPSIVTFFFSLVPKIVFFVLIIRFCFDVFLVWGKSFKIFFFFSVFFSLVVGSFFGIFQYKIKRLLAYSSIANVGFFMIGILTEGLEGVIASLVYFVIYFFMVSIFFFFLIFLRYYNNFFKFKNIMEFGSLLNINSFIVFFFVLNLFSLIGVPPLSGFFGKFFLFFSLVLHDMPFILFLGMLSSVLAGYYYLRLIRVLLFKKFQGFVFLLPVKEVLAIFSFFFLFFNILFFFDMIYFFKFLYCVFYYSFFGILELFFF
jgi:NADH-quinone oxidoreductase subunit N